MHNYFSTYASDVFKGEQYSSWGKPLTNSSKRLHTKQNAYSFQIQDILKSHYTMLCCILPVIMSMSDTSILLFISLQNQNKLVF